MHWGNESLPQDVLIDTAERIGRRICDSAIWTNDRCTWQTWLPVDFGDRYESGVASSDLYQGASGIALFLAELHAATGDPRAKRTAAGGLRYALETLADASTDYAGLYAGWPGVVLVAARCGHLWKDDECSFAARRVFARNAHVALPSVRTDLVNGASGTILALLSARSYVELEGVDEYVIALGDQLVQVAHRRPSGWSWKSTEMPVMDDLVGYAHGTAGIAHSLRELARVSGLGKFAFAADEAMRYERLYFDAERGAWRDLRYEIPFASSPRNDVVRELPVGPPMLRTKATIFPSTWCHGCSGIGLARLRAIDTDPSAHSAADVRTAAASIAQWDDIDRVNYCLCHGALGNAEFLMEALVVTGDRMHRERAITRALRGREEFELGARVWPTNLLGERELTFMTGEAGIGYFYLRLANAAVPSMLALQVPKVSGGMKMDSYRELRDENVEQMFRESLDVFTGHASARTRVLERIHESARERPLHEAANGVLTELLQSRGQHNATEAQMRALRRDCANAELLELPFDSAIREGGIDARLSRETVPWDKLRVTLASSARIVDATLPPTARTDSVGDELLIRRDRSVRRLTLSAFTSAVLRPCAFRTADIAAIMVSAGELLNVSEHDEAVLLHAVQDQILAAWRSGILTLWQTF